MNGDRIGRQLSLATRQELIEAIAARYRAGTRIEKKTILDEFIEVTGFHRKHAIRALRKACRAETVVTEKVPRARLYNEAAIAALTVLGRRLIESAESGSRRLSQPSLPRWNGTGIYNSIPKCGSDYSR